MQARPHKSQNALNISGGFVDGWVFGRGSTATISGGILGDRISAESGDLTLVGDKFRLDGRRVKGLGEVGDSVLLDGMEGRLLSGILADGTPFAFPYFNADAVSLLRSELPPLGFTYIYAPSQPVPTGGLREAVTLHVEDGATVDDHFTAAWGSRLVISGGAIGSELEAVGAVVDIISGTVGRQFGAHAGSVVNISGGSIAENFHTRQSEVNITGGFVDSVRLGDSSSANITGGAMGHVEQRTGSVVNVSEDASILDLRLFDGSVANISGGAIGETSIRWPVFPYEPLVLRGSSSANITDGRLETGIVALSGSVVNISGPANAGTVFHLGGSLILRESSTANISGGIFEDHVTADSGSVVNVWSGATIPAIYLSSGSAANISGGSVDEYIQIEEESRLAISGGQINADLIAFAGSHVDLVGTAFFIDGDPLEGLVQGEPFIVAQRGVVLSGQLRDGSDFRFSLESFEPDAAIAVTLLPEPSAILLAIGTLMLSALPLRRSCRKSRDDSAMQWG